MGTPPLAWPGRHRSHVKHCLEPSPRPEDGRLAHVGQVGPTGAVVTSDVSLSLSPARALLTKSVRLVGSPLEASRERHWYPIPRKLTSVSFPCQPGTKRVGQGEQKLGRKYKSSTRRTYCAPGPTGGECVPPVSPAVP